MGQAKTNNFSKTYTALALPESVHDARDVDDGGPGPSQTNNQGEKQWKTRCRWTEAAIKKMLNIFELLRDDKELGKPHKRMALWKEVDTPIFFSLLLLNDLFLYRLLHS